MFGASINVKAAALPGVNLRMLLLSWSIAELIALMITVKLLGWSGTFLLTAASSVLGVILLRRIGFEAARRLGRRVAGRSSDGALFDGTLAAVGALLLILPGFVSDLAGLALAAPSVRQALRKRLGGRSDGPRADPLGRRTPLDVIDLPPSDWRDVAEVRRDFAQ